MLVTPDEGPEWDLSPVFELLRTFPTAPHPPFAGELLSVGGEPSSGFRSASVLPQLDGVKEERDNKLGDFSKIWEFLGQPLDVPPPSVSPPSSSDEERAPETDSNPNESTFKGVRWRDEVHGTDLEDVDEHDLDVEDIQSKSKRKKERRKERKRAASEIAELGKSDGNRYRTSSLRSQIRPLDMQPTSESEAEIDIRKPEPQASARKDIINSIVHSPGPGASHPTPKKAARYICLAGPPIALPQAVSIAKQQRIQQLKAGLKNGSLPKSEARSILQQLAVHSRSHTPGFVNPSGYVLSQVPASVVPRARSEPVQCGELGAATARKMSLIARLSVMFHDEKKTFKDANIVLNPRTLEPHGIHVFVDISNILIGFHDALKSARGLPSHARLPRQILSFHNFSLILERGRPVAKRCLAGSDNLESIQEAKGLGYEVNILERVMKTKEPTARQKKFIDAATRRSGASSGSETPHSYPAPQMKFSEQGVDEILHLKMLESILDAEEPSTIVLATGDAAEAEYSAGFSKMLERALLRKWKVELICFSQNMSYTYKSEEWRSRWGNAFRTIPLDSYAEDLRGD